MQPPTELDYYRILGVSQDATIVEIKAAFRKLALVHHPDKAQNQSEDAKADAAAFLKIREAQETLCDEFKRTTFDLKYARIRLEWISYEAWQIEQREKEQRRAQAEQQAQAQQQSKHKRTPAFDHGTYVPKSSGPSHVNSSAEARQNRNPPETSKPRQASGTAEGTTSSRHWCIWCGYGSHTSSQCDVPEHERQVDHDNLAANMDHIINEMRKMRHKIELDRQEAEKARQAEQAARWAETERIREQIAAARAAKQRVAEERSRAAAQKAREQQEERAKIRLQREQEEREARERAERAERLERGEQERAEQIRLAKESQARERARPAVPSMPDLLARERSEKARLAEERSAEVIRRAREQQEQAAKERLAKIIKQKKMSGRFRPPQWSKKKEPARCFYCQRDCKKVAYRCPDQDVAACETCYKRVCLYCTTCVVFPVTHLEGCPKSTDNVESTFRRAGLL